MAGPAGAEEVGVDPARVREVGEALERALGSVVVGQPEAVRGVVTCLLLGAHALLEGVPGLGKTTLARAAATAAAGSYGRIQFTPDLLPADVTGTVTLVERFEGAPALAFEEGPVFANVVLADEINRASPRTQSALLEAMQEGTVTARRTTYRLPQPFTVLATQNPVELQGTYPLPEAQLDRFLLELRFAYPDAEQLVAIVEQTAERPVAPPLAAVTSPEELLALGAAARAVPAAPHVLKAIARLVLSLQPGVRPGVRLGPSPRGAQALSLAGRVHALLSGRFHLAVEDVVAVARPALRHRLVLGFDALRDGVTADALVEEAVAAVDV